MELEPTWRRTLHIWWAYFWRNLIAIVCAMLIGAVVGFALGATLGAAGVDPDTIRTVSAPIGFVIGLAISIVPIWLILGKDFGEFRLVLLSNERSGVDPGRMEAGRSW